jgi:hypothetical protein
MKNLFSGYTQEESSRIEKTLDHLISCIDPNKIVFVGSLPIRYFFEQLDISYRKKDLADLDAILPSLKNIKENVTDYFSIYHVHNYPDYKSKYFSFKFFVAMVDKETNIKMDIFSDYPYTPENVIKYPYKNSFIKLQSAEDQLITQVLEAERIMLEIEGGRLDYKRRDIIRNLQKAVNMGIAEKYWLKRDFKQNGRTLQETIGVIESYIEKHGKDALKYLKTKRAKPCKHCVEISGLPLSSPEEANNYLFPEK